jgi:N-methylhydantoinase A
MNARLKATGKIKSVPVPEIGEGKEVPENAIKGKRRIFIEGRFIEVGIYERSGLLSGNRINGPAIVEEPFHTTVVMTGQSLEVDRTGNLIIGTGGA